MHKGLISIKVPVVTVGGVVVAGLTVVTVGVVKGVDVAVVSVVGTGVLAVVGDSVVNVVGVVVVSVPNGKLHAITEQRQELYVVLTYALDSEFTKYQINVPYYQFRDR